MTAKSSTPPLRKLVSSKWRIAAICLAIVIFSQVTFLSILLRDNVNLKNDIDFARSSYSNLQQNYSSLQNDYDELSNTSTCLKDNYTSLNSEYQNLATNYSNLLEDFQSLNSSYHSLQLDYANLQNIYSDLQNNYSPLRTSYQSLQNNYSDLNNSYSSLQSSHSLLQSDYNNLQSSYNSSSSNYLTLQSQFNAYIQAYLQLRDQVNIHSTHPTQSEKSLVTPSDPSVVSTMRQVTGGWSNQSDWNECWTDEKKLYDWVANNIKYAKDPSYPSLPLNPSWGMDWSLDNWQFPNETLRTKQGDCEDQALLLLSLIRAYTSQRYPAYCIVKTGHAAVFFPVEGDKICILDPTMRYTTNDGGPSHNLDAKDTRQEVSNWLNYVGGVELVKCIFSDSFYKTFSGTEDFITWSYQ